MWISKVTTAAHETKRSETKDINSIMIPLALKKDQIKFVDFANKHRHIHSTTKKSLLSCNTLFDNLIHRIFCGELQ